MGHAVFLIQGQRFPTLIHHSSFLIFQFKDMKRHEDFEGCLLLSENHWVPTHTCFTLHKHYAVKYSHP